MAKDENMKNEYGKEMILADLMEIMKEMTSGWGAEFEKPIGPNTFLGADLGLKSLDFIRVVSAIQQHYSQKLIPFQKIFESDDGQVLQDLCLSNIVDFLYKHLNSE